jgi:hypothetical protein
VWYQKLHILRLFLCTRREGPKNTNGAEQQQQQLFFVTQKADFVLGKRKKNKELL